MGQKTVKRCFESVLNPILFYLPLWIRLSYQCKTFPSWFLHANWFGMHQFDCRKKGVRKKIKISTLFLCFWADFGSGQMSCFKVLLKILPKNKGHLNVPKNCRYSNPGTYDFCLYTLNRLIDSKGSFINFWQILHFW